MSGIQALINYLGKGIQLSNVEQTNNATAATKSVLIAGKNVAGNAPPLKMTTDGKLAISSGDCYALTNYTKVIDRDKYQIWYPTSKIMAAHKNIAVKWYPSPTNLLQISTDGIDGSYAYSTTFDSTHFPGLISGSVVAFMLILPWTRNLTTYQNAVNWRLVVITDKGQIYHNYPSRAVGSDGTEVAGDITKFEESVVWDLPERKFPSTNAGASGVERYFPCLPADNYVHHPILNTDGGFVDTYGNGGFGISITHSATTYPRFYRPFFSANMNSFSFMNGFEPGNKLSIIGTYQSNSAAGGGTRIGVFATSDGGRSWYLKYEFGDCGVYPNYGNNINTSALASAYTADSFVMKKRDVVSPAAGDLEPVTSFTLGADVVISAITRATPAVVTTSTPHGLTSGNIIAILDNSGSAATSADWDWMRNDTISTTSGGTGVLFKVKVLTTTTFELYEEVHSAYNPITARHIHNTNKIKDGWIISSGEEHPDGWLLFMQCKNTDSYDVKYAYDAYTITRLNSSAAGVQRVIGAIMEDDATSSVIFASDSALIARGNITLPTGRTDTVSRSSIGIFKGALADIDDFSKFTALCNVREPAYYFREHFGVFVYIGQGGEFAISFDRGVTWERERLTFFDVSHYTGQDENRRIIIGNMILALK